MSKPAGKCAFCGGPGLTKSHIWPEWVEKFLPVPHTHHEQLTGQFATFVPTAAHPDFERRVKQGHVGTRKPRNTCVACNGKWMRTIEEATLPFMEQLLNGTPYLLETFSQRALATFLCLVTMRLELASTMKPIPAAHRDWIRTHFEPPPGWQIWIAKYEGAPVMDERFMAIQIASSPDVPRGIEHCNTQVSTFVVGALCAHLYSSTVWDDFPGYEGAFISRIWPPHQFDIDTSLLPIISEPDVPWLHETIARDKPNIPA